jgi:ribosome-associated heat shock protein Hsp15
VKHRSNASALIEAGNIRINRERVTKTAQNVKAGDVVTLTLHGGVKIIRVLDEAQRRGPAAEARQLYQDIKADTQIMDA